MFGLKNLPHWKDIVLILSPALLIPLPLIAGTVASRCAYVVLLMAVMFMTEAVPLGMTTFMPAFAFPLLGIVTAKDICQQYFKNSNVMFMSGLIIAMAVESCNLHKRIALHVLVIMGTKLRWLMLGLMLTTSVLSMWVSNTATVAMMISIVDALLEDLYQEQPIQNNTISFICIEKGNNNEEKLKNSLKDKITFKQLRKCFLFALGYAANIGGTGTLIGTSSSLVFRGLLSEIYGENTEINFSTYMLFSVPGVFLCTIAAWLWLQVYFLWGKGAGEKNEKVSSVLKDNLKRLGPLSFNEGAVIAVYAVTVVLWLTRDPKFVSGWGQLFFGGEYVDDAAIGMFAVFFLFVIPADPHNTAGVERKGQSKKLISWQEIQQKMPWNIVMLLGGGYALAYGCHESGLSTWISLQLKSLSHLPEWAILLIICLLTTFVTEVSSKNATCTILMPVLSQLCEGIGMNPLYLMLPSAITCSFAFMLPVATASNAIVYHAAGIKPSEMMKPGFLMNLICVGVTFLMTETLGVWMFDLHKYPEWANRTTLR